MTVRVSGDRIIHERRRLLSYSTASALNRQADAVRLSSRPVRELFYYAREQNDRMAEMTEDQLKQLLAMLRSQFPLQEINSPHAPDHWERVERYGILLSRRTGADLLVVRLFAIFHDCRRMNDAIDRDHGPRAAELALQMCGDAFELEAWQLGKLVQACREHDNGRTSSDPTVGSCWDADRLDLDRIGIMPKSQFMSTEYGRVLAEMRPLDRQKLAGITV